MPPPQHVSIRVKFSAAVGLILAGGMLAGWLWPYVRALDPGNTVMLIRSWGAWGVLGSIGLMVAHSFLPFPSEIIAIANGMVYGPLWGSVITWTGAMLGATSAFALARWLGRPFLESALSPRRQQQLKDWSRERGTTALLIGRLIPLISFNVINYAAALTEISWWSFLWTTGIGILPLTLLLNIFGDRMLTMPLWVWLAMTVLALLCGLAPRFRR